MQIPSQPIRYLVHYSDGKKINKYKNKQIQRKEWLGDLGRHRCSFPRHNLSSLIDFVNKTLSVLWSRGWGVWGRGCGVCVGDFHFWIAFLDGFIWHTCRQIISQLTCHICFSAGDLSFSQTTTPSPPPPPPQPKWFVRPVEFQDLTSGRTALMFRTAPAKWTSWLYIWFFFFSLSSVHLCLPSFQGCSSVTWISVPSFKRHSDWLPRLMKSFLL